MLHPQDQVWIYKSYTFCYSDFADYLIKFAVAAVLAPVLQSTGNTIHRINYYTANSVVCFVNSYPLDSDLSDGERFPFFKKKTGPVCRI